MSDLWDWIVNLSEHLESGILSLVESGGLPQAQLVKMLDGFLTRPADRALFDLPPIS